MKYSVLFFLSILPLLSFSQDSTTNKKQSIEVKNYFQLVADSMIENQAVLQFNSDTTEIGKEKGLDEKIDALFRPIADFVGTIIFYPIKIGTSSQQCSFSVTEAELAQVGGSLIVKLDDFKIDQSKAVDEIEILQGDATVKSGEDGAYILVRSSGEVELEVSGTNFQIPLVLIVLIGGALFFNICTSFYNHYI